MFCRPMLPLRFTSASLIRIGSLDGNSLDISVEQAEVAPARLISRDVLLLHNSVGFQSDQITGAMNKVRTTNGAVLHVSTHGLLTAQ